MTGFYLFLLALVVLSFMKMYLPVYLRKRRYQNRYKNTHSYTTETSDEEDTIPSIANPYKPVYLLSKNEKYAYLNLKKICDSNGLFLFAKVRLLDLIAPTSNDYRLLNRIKSKHVDFVICDGNLIPKWIIELDDNSHNQPDRASRDDFVDKSLSDCGYKILRTHYIREDQALSFLGLSSFMASMPGV